MKARPSGLADREHGGGMAVAEVEAVLHGDHVDDSPRGRELLDADVGDADVADLALALQFLQRPDRLLVRDLGIGGVQLVEVDAVDPQAFQRSLAGLAQVLGAPVAGPLARTGPGQAALGRDHQAVGVGMKRLGDQLLADIGPVGVGGVDQVDAELDCAPQHGDRFVVVVRRSPDTVAGDPHRPVTEAPDREVAEGRGADRLVADRVCRHRPTG
jgi:hypothetical protein